MRKRKISKFNNGWCFAIVNGRLAEIYFDEKYGIYGHCYIKRKDYTKKEQKMINSDIKKCQFTYRKRYYIDKKQGTKQKAPNIYKMFPEIRKYQNEAKRIYSKK